MAMSVLISDPHYNRGNYYPPQSLTPPHIGMKLARQIATITYRSGPEWELRFGRNRADPSKPPALCPDFLIETYLDHAGEKWCLEYDANSFLYLSKAMDLFDLGREAEIGVERTRGKEVGEAACSIPDVPYEEVEGASVGNKVGGASAQLGEADVEVNGVSRDLIDGMKGMKDIPALVMGVKSDILFPAWQQREIAGALKESGNEKVKYVELGEDVSMFGHDTFLLDTVNVGEEVGRFLKD
jgi:homoserine acetyltransferase